MAQLLQLKTFSDNRGHLTVIEKVVPFTIQRIFYIYGVDNSERGGHRHKATRQAAICIQGSCKIYVDNGSDEQTYHLQKPYECLLIECADWHKMFEFSSDCILMVLASENFDQNDYIFESYQK